MLNLITFHLHRIFNLIFILGKLVFFNNLFKTIGNLLCYLFPIFGLAYTAAIYFGLATTLSTTAKVITGAVTGGVILVGTVVKTIYDAKEKKD